MSDSVRPHRWQPTRLHPWDFPGKSTGVSCHCLLWYTWESTVNSFYNPCLHSHWHYLNFMSYLCYGFLCGTGGYLPTSEGDIGEVRDPASISGSERSPGGRNGNPLQYFCLENPMNRGTWRATVHGVTKSWKGLKQFSRHTPLLQQRSPNFIVNLQVKFIPLIRSAIS